MGEEREANREDGKTLCEEAQPGQEAAVDLASTPSEQKAGARDGTWDTRDKLHCIDAIWLPC